MKIAVISFSVFAVLAVTVAGIAARPEAGVRTLSAREMAVTIGGCGAQHCADGTADCPHDCEYDETSHWHKENKIYTPRTCTGTPANSCKASNETWCCHRFWSCLPQTCLECSGEGSYDWQTTSCQSG